MRYLLLPFFCIYLAFSLSSTIIDVLLARIGLTKQSIAVILIVALTVLNSFAFSQAVSTPPPLPSRDDHEYQRLLGHTLEWLSKQPTHRDLLYNASMLYAFFGNDVDAEYYRGQAQVIDPNFGAFKP